MRLRKSYYVIQEVATRFFIDFMDEDPFPVSRPEQATLYDFKRDALEDILYLDDVEYRVVRVSINCYFEE